MTDEDIEEILRDLDRDEDDKSIRAPERTPPDQEWELRFLAEEREEKRAERAQRRRESGRQATGGADDEILYPNRWTVTHRSRRQKQLASRLLLLNANTDLYTE